VTDVSGATTPYRTGNYADVDLVSRAFIDQAKVEMKRDKRKERTERTEGTAVEVAVASSAAALGLTHPVLGAVAGGISPAVAEGIKAVVRRLVGRQREKSEYVLAWVAHLARH
jgi:hypothetical protein